MEDGTFARITAEDRAAIVALLAAGRSVEAVRLARDAGGLDLAVAHAYVQGLRDAPPSPSSPGAAWPGVMEPTTSVPGIAGISVEAGTLARIDTELREGRLIGAIKLYREATGAGLVDAKHVIEARRDLLFPFPSARASGRFNAGAAVGSGGQPGFGRLVAIVVAVAIVAIALAFVAHTFSAL